MSARPKRRSMYFMNREMPGAGIVGSTVPDIVSVRLYLSEMTEKSDTRLYPL